MQSLLYLVPIPLDAGQQDGVLKKIFMQGKVFAEHFNTHIIGYYGKGIGVYKDGQITSLIDNVSGHLRRFALYRAAKVYVRENDIRNIYIRYGFSEFSFISFLKYVKRAQGTKICIEIPTYPYDVEMRKKRRIYSLFNYFDRMTRTSLKKYVDRIYTFSDDKEIYGIPAEHIVNGIDFNDVSIHKNNISPGKIRLIAVSAMGFNHGYDRMIDGMRDYYRSGANELVYFDLVGDGAEKQRYAEMIDEYGLSEYVTLHGFKSGAELDALFDSADIAIASLGMHRLNVFLASTLKTREYGAKGLPIVTSCKIDVYDSDWVYLLNVNADETPVDICSVVNFYHSIYDGKPAEEVASEIRLYAENRCEIHNVMANIIDYYERTQI